MAAIDKLYVRTYKEYDNVRRWALAYYPKLLIYFYSIDLRLEDFKLAQPIKMDRLRILHKLKWICPVPCVREYLHEQCGVNPKWEWLYRKFWRGKKYF